MQRCSTVPYLSLLANNWFFFTGNSNFFQLPKHFFAGITRIGQITLFCNSVFTVAIGCIPFIKWEEMVVEGVKKTKHRHPT